MVEEARPDGTDLSRVRVNNDYELDYWAQRFRVSREEVRRAVEKVGAHVDEVEHELGRNVG
jgi:hypothetical protein